MKQLVLMLALFPVLAFCVAAIFELRATTKPAGKLRNLIPAILGLAEFGLSLDPQGILHVSPASSVTLSRVMTLLSAMIACSGVFITYSRRSTAVWMACGGLVMLFFWIFNRVVV